MAAGSTPGGPALHGVSCVGAVSFSCRGVAMALSAASRVGKRRVYGVDVGSTQRGSFAWACVDPDARDLVAGSHCIELLSARVIADLRARRSVALGLEAPLFIPIPVAASRLSKARTDEGSPCWAAPPGLTVASLGLHQAAWILRRIAKHCGDFIDFRVAPTAWPPSPDVTMLFCWEAFVSGPAHSSTHLADAATAAMAFVNLEHRLPEATAVTAEYPLSLIGAAALWSGLVADSELLRTSTVVVRPASGFQGEVLRAEDRSRIS